MKFKELKFEGFLSVETSFSIPDGVIDTVKDLSYTGLICSYICKSDNTKLDLRPLKYYTSHN